MLLRIVVGVYLVIVPVKEKDPQALEKTADP
jgi:hypothetical protein